MNNVHVHVLVHAVDILLVLLLKLSLNCVELPICVGDIPGSIQ